MNKLCKEYSKIILTNYKNLNPIFIFYGSNIYKNNYSDLDVAIVFKEKLQDEIKEQLINETINFQKQNGLRIDEEVPFENKLIYTISDLDEIFKNSPFKSGNEYKIDEIVKTKEFLSSQVMKKRLMINILTTDHKVMNDNDKQIKKYENLAWKEILSLLKYRFKTNMSKLYRVLDHLYVNPETKLAGEMYLGYKLNHPSKIKYLKRKTKKYLKMFNNKI